jgi:hypothetical protein
LMNVVKVHETLPYHFLCCHELLCFVLARCWSTLVEPWDKWWNIFNAKTFYCISNYVTYFPYQYNDKKWNGFSSI